MGVGAIPHGPFLGLEKVRGNCAPGLASVAGCDAPRTTTAADTGRASEAVAYTLACRGVTASRVFRKGWVAEEADPPKPVEADREPATLAPPANEPTANSAR